MWESTIHKVFECCGVCFLFNDVYNSPVDSRRLRLRIIWPAIKRPAIKRQWIKKPRMQWTKQIQIAVDQASRRHGSGPSNQEAVDQETMNAVDQANPECSGPSKSRVQWWTKQIQSAVDQAKWTNQTRGGGPRNTDNAVVQANSECSEPSKSDLRGSGPNISVGNRHANWIWTSRRAKKF